MSLADELKKLEDLRRSGALTDEEFTKAKASLLTAPAGNAVPDNLSTQLGDVRYQNELARIDREWESEKEKYKLAARYGARYIPTKGMGIAYAVFGGVFGALLTLMPLVMLNQLPEWNRPPSALIAFVVLVGVAFTAGMIWFGVHVIRKAEAYDKALAAYQARRAAVKPEDFR